MYDVRFDAQFHYVCYRYKPFARVLHFVIPGVHPLPRQPHPAGCFNWLYQCCVTDAVYVQPRFVWTFFFQVCTRVTFWCPFIVLVFYSVLRIPGNCYFTVINGIKATEQDIRHVLRHTVCMVPSEQIKTAAYAVTDARYT